MNNDDDVYISYRKNHQRQLDALQQSLEEENKAKNDAIRQKKAAEEQLDDIQANLESAQKVCVAYTLGNYRLGNFQ